VTPGADTLTPMVHLRIVVPHDLTQRVIALLETSSTTCNLILLEGAARKPEGDLVLCDIAREETSVMIEDLKEIGVTRQGSISIDEIDSQISDAARRAERAAPGAPSDAVIWEEVEARTSENTELGGTFVWFMALACLIASVGIFVGSPILIVGAMIVGPEFGPLAGLCVAVIERRRGVAMRSLNALAVGFPIGITAAFLFTLFCVAVGIVDSGFHSTENDLIKFIVEPEEFSLIVALFAGAAGMLSLTSTKSGALIGVLVSVTTIPAAANIGVSAALGNWHNWVGAMEQLSINLSAIVLSGVVTLYLQRVLYERRRDHHLGDRSRAHAGLPADDDRSRYQRRVDRQSGAP
jgi:uncharacterized hydrophobic protein (TIGR00271 family)